MAVVMESNSASEQEIKQVLESHGITPTEPVVPPVDDKKPAEEKKEPSESTGEPGDKVPAETGDKAPADTETADKSQETPQEPKPAEPKPEKAKGGYQAKIEKLTKDRDRIEAERDQERGDKTKIQKQLDEVTAQLTALQPKEPAKEAELVRPKRPKMDDPEISFDQDKLDAANEVYDQKLDEYYDAVSKKRAKEEVAALQVANEKAAQTARDNASLAELNGRIVASKTAYDDFDQVRDELPSDGQDIISTSDVVRGYIGGKSKAPAHLIYFFAKDFLEDGGAEGERIGALDPYDQILELASIEKELIRKSGKAKEPVKVAEVEAEPAKEPEKPPVKEQPKARTPDAPITPVGGGRVAGTPMSLEKAAEQGPRAYREVRQREIAARIAGRV